MWEDSLKKKRFAPGFGHPFTSATFLEYPQAAHKWTKEVLKVVDEIEPIIEGAGGKI